MMSPLIECVPNFSEGRDRARFASIISAVEAVAGVLVLDRTSDRDHHRSVLTFAGGPGPVLEAAVAAAAKAVELIDLTAHQGIHPRVGALDVLPFVPLHGATVADCVALAHEAGERIEREIGLPVYFYGAAAVRPDRVALEDVRRGQFEGLLDAAPSDPARAPDLGGPALHPTAGAAIVGARKILIAFNINLRSSDLALARQIARQIRTSSGGFRAVKALGVPLASRNMVQVSVNLTDYEQTPLHVVYAAVERLAAAANVSIEESEIIGLLPRSAWEAAVAHAVKLPPDSSQKILEEKIRPLLVHVEKFGGPYLPGEKVC